MYEDVNNFLFWVGASPIALWSSGDVAIDCLLPFTYVTGRGLEFSSGYVTKLPERGMCGSCQ